jgi:small nuclear ribonucleoprotein (snRNP)-like protein
VPDQIVEPITTYDSPNVIINWVVPFNGGSEITSYSILVREADGVTFTAELTNCDGSDSTILASAECTIPTSVLRSTPFNLWWGDSVKVQIYATNIKGDSIVSDIGNGAIILRVPDAPLNLENAADVTAGE